VRHLVLVCLESISTARIVENAFEVRDLVDGVKG
jgi:hypothetical protein